MENDSTTISTGGLTISFDTKYAIQISTPNRLLWSGSVGQLEAMCESHQLLKDAAKQLVSSVHVKDKCINVTDARELNNSIVSAVHALHMAY